ncbi:MAG: hypothetical protein ACYDFT_06495 [Thermoplasmata archaeon]
MRGLRLSHRFLLGGLGAAAALALTGGAAASNGQSIVQQVTPLIWVIVAISVGGTAITYGFLLYAAWRFRDPSTRRRNYG